MFLRWRRLFGGKSRQSDLEEVQGIIGYRFTDLSLLEEALTHRSFLSIPGNEHLPSYERLEFLGDSVLGVCVAEYLHQRFDTYSEGELTKLKAGLVNLHSLTELSRSLGLGEFIRLSPEERKAGGDGRPSILSDIFESITGAVFLDGDLEEARGWIKRVLLNDFDHWRTQIEHVNYKGDLLEYMQARAMGMPRYEVKNESGPDHEKTFTVCVYCAGRNMGTGIGTSKKEAEQAAAEEALHRITADRPDLEAEKED